MGGLNINIDPFRSKREREDAKRRRQEIAAGMFERLVEAGYQPEDINAFNKKFIDTGDFSLPTTREVVAPGPGPEGPASPEGGYLPNVQQVPIRLRKKQGGLWTQNKDGKWEFQSAPEGVESVNVARDSGGMVDVLDPQGNVVGQAPRGSLRLPVGSEEADPQVKARIDVAKKVIQDYYNTEEPDENQRNAAADAADFLGLPVEEVTQKRSPIAKFFGFKDKKVRAPSFGGSPGKPSGAPTKTVNGVTYRKESDGKWHRQ